MSPHADLVVVNAALWSGAPRPGADALAIRGGQVLATGTTADLAALEGPETRRLDARGATVTPGLTDAHLHLLAWARSLGAVDLAGCRTRAEALARIRHHLDDHPGSTVVLGRGWEAEAWSEAPDRAALDALTDERPVLLHSRDFHNLWVNSAALRAAGIDRHRRDPAGGQIDRDAAGEPTGLLREHAVGLCAALEAARPDDAELVCAAVRRLHAFGITAVHDFEGADAQRILRALSRGAQPSVRVLMHLPHAALEHALQVGLESGVGDDRFRLGAVKLFADGTLGSRTAALLEPYDGTEERGLELLSPEELRSTVRRALERGLSVAIHTIGDRACRSALDAFEAARDLIPRSPLPPRLEHLQLVDPEDLPRLAGLGVAASMQPTHCTSDIELVERWWSSRRDRAYPWRSLLGSGALMAFGSDAPVESPSVALGLHAAVTRQRVGRSEAFVPEQRVSLDDALAAYTSGPARLGGFWPRVGSLEPGSRADAVVWSANLHRLSPRSLCEAYPVVTIVDGELVFERDAEPAPMTGRPAALEGARAGGGTATW